MLHLGVRSEVILVKKALLLNFDWAQIVGVNQQREQNQSRATEIAALETTSTSWENRRTFGFKTED